MTARGVPVILFHGVQVGWFRRSVLVARRVAASVVGLGGVRGPWSMAGGRLVSADTLGSQDLVCQISYV